MLFLAVAIQFFLYTRKPSTYLHYMTEILPFLFLLFGVALADLFARYGTKYRTLLLADLGVFYLGALVVFWNYWPSIWGRATP
jgi:dolichyl-phosphate-mannose--protein O-mannosyl transferase